MDPMRVNPIGPEWLILSGEEDCSLFPECRRTGLMKLDRQLARTVAAMIVMIIASLAPSAVLAHAGHHHEPPAVVSSSGATPAPDVISFGSYGAVTPSALAIEPATVD